MIRLKSPQHIEQLVREGGKAKLLKDKTRINQELRSLLDRLDEMK